MSTLAALMSLVDSYKCDRGTRWAIRDAIEAALKAEYERGRSEPEQAAGPPKREPLAGCSDLRDAKRLDPECCEAGACQSLRFKNKREPLTEHINAKYNELLLAVGNKYPNESRHDTALRYIRQAERSRDMPANRAHGIGETLQLGE